MPTCGGAYGSYIGRIDSVPDSYNNVSYSNAANDNDNSGYGIGSQNYFVLTGPLSDPSYNGTDAEALAYGKSQGDIALDNWVSFYSGSSAYIPGYPIIYADLEDGGGGWSSNTTLNREDFNGYFDQVHDAQEHLGRLGPFTIFAGAYTTADWWSTNMEGTIGGGVFESTAQYSYSTPSSGDCASAWESPAGSTTHYAVFFASYSQSSACAGAWQWIAGDNDYDQLFGERIAEGMSNGDCN